MKISIIITFYKNLNILYQCLFHLKNHLPTHTDFEIILVNDNPSFRLSNNTEIKILLPKIKIIDNNCNLGYAGACNKAVEKANGQVIVLMDSDIMVTDSWIENMYSLLQNHEDAGGISPVILNMEDNSILHYGFATNKIDMVKPYFCRPVTELPQELFTKNLEFPTLTSGCCMFRKSLYIKINGMNESLYNGYCDTDMFYKFHEAGFKNYLNAQTRVYHRGCVSGEVRTVMKADTKALFCSQWGTKYSCEGLAIIQNMYENQIKPSKKCYLLFNFSASLFSKDYIELLQKILQIEQVYQCAAHQKGTLILEDHISLSLQHSAFSLLYFCDDYRDLAKNYFWFNSRKNMGDLIVDRNGNVITCC